jgi:glycerol-3-phosphate dehydrogenase (NAD(P)+)
VVICAKGLEQATGKLMGTVLGEVLPQALQAALSGPSFAADVARGLPAALTLACNNEETGQALAQAIGYRHFPAFATARMLRAFEPAAHLRARSAVSISTG